MNLSPLDDHLSAPRGRGRLADSPHAAAAGGAICGDAIRVAVRVDGDRVEDAGFDASGCAAVRAAGSAVVELVRGAPLRDALLVAPDTVSDALGGLSPGRIHAAELVCDALHGALGAAAAGGAARISPDARRTLVAMSGGVDSAVAAQLACEAGDDVLAVTLQLWSDPGHDGTRSCCSPQAVRTARALAHRMGIPHVTLDARPQFAHAVVDDFVAEHAAGRTPNPCVRCNGLVRFDTMLALAERLGAARLATGHYARVARDERGPLVRAAADPDKDQAYMLARLDPADLERLSFPLGELDKPHVRALARAAGLPVAEKPESQDLCFLAGIGGGGFLARRGLGERPGDVVDIEGRRLGGHAGQHRFTVGQRRGIGVAASEPLYVVDKDARANTVTVGPRAALEVRCVRLLGTTLHRPAREVDRVKLRYRSAPLACRLAADGRELLLDEPARGVAPGQTACLLRGDAVAGWATIAPPRVRPNDEPAHDAPGTRELAHAQ